MANSVEVEGLDELIESFSNASSNVNRIGRGFLKQLSDYGVKQVQINILNIGAVDTNELIQGIHYKISQISNGLESVIKPSDKADEYADDIEFGTKPHWVSIDDLQGWANRHGIPAYLVQRKIAREGTQPRPYWQPAFEDLDKHVNGELSDFANEIARYL